MTTVHFPLTYMYYVYICTIHVYICIDICDTRGKNSKITKNARFCSKIRDETMTLKNDNTKTFSFYDRFHVAFSRLSPLKIVSFLRTRRRDTFKINKDPLCNVHPFRF